LISAHRSLRELPPALLANVAFSLSFNLNNFFNTILPIIQGHQYKYFALSFNKKQNKQSFSFGHSKYYLLNKQQTLQAHTKLMFLKARKSCTTTIVSAATFPTPL
jgi:hypothetical protein